jgi:hypothetical protein
LYYDEGHKSAGRDFSWYKHAIHQNVCKLCYTELTFYIKYILQSATEAFSKSQPIIHLKLLNLKYFEGQEEYLLSTIN